MDPGHANRMKPVETSIVGVRVHCRRPCQRTGASVLAALEALLLALIPSLSYPSYPRPTMSRDSLLRFLCPSTYKNYNHRKNENSIPELSDQMGVASRVQPVQMPCDRPNTPEICRQQNVNLVLIDLPLSVTPSPVQRSRY